MSEMNKKWIGAKLKNIQGALTNIEKRFREVPDVEYFRSEAGWERRDGICMLFQAVGETFKQIDELSNKTFLSRYPEIVWRDVVGFRNIIAHNYFDIDEDLLFQNCQVHLPPLLATVNRMIEELSSNETL